MSFSPDFIKTVGGALGLRKTSENRSNIWIHILMVSISFLGVASLIFERNLPGETDYEEKGRINLCDFKTPAVGPNINISVWFSIESSKRRIGMGIDSKAMSILKESCFNGDEVIVKYRAVSLIALPKIRYIASSIYVTRTGYIVSHN